MNPEECWEQTEKKWESRVINPHGLTRTCGFCTFVNEQEEQVLCEMCPVVKVYGEPCEEVASVKAYCDTINPNVEELSTLAKAVVQELDDKKDELIAAMYEILRGENGKA